jgi:hypothetical protein
MLRLVALYFIYLVFSSVALFLLALGAGVAGLDPSLFGVLAILVPAVAAFAAAKYPPRKDTVRFRRSIVTALAVTVYIGALFFVGALYHSARQEQSGPRRDETAAHEARTIFDRMLHGNPNFRPLIWPPPDPSAFSSIPSKFFGSDSSLADVAEDLAKALNHAGYSKFSYFYAPYGFAIVTGIEQINDDGSPLDSRRRWFAEPAVEFSLSEYLRLLLGAPIGRYRAIVFVVIAEYYGPSGIRITRDELGRLSALGGVALPDLYRSVMFRSPPYKVDALIYEFKGRAGSEPVLVNPSAIAGDEHLIKAQIWPALETQGIAK